MKTFARVLALILVVFVASACATGPGNPAMSSRDPFCDQQARVYADTGGGVLQGLLGGGAVGAGVGAAGGAIAKGGRGAGKGAAIGAIVGAAVGVAVGAARAGGRYDRAYEACMQARPTLVQAPPPPSAAVMVPGGQSIHFPPGVSGACPYGWRLENDYQFMADGRGNMNYTYAGFWCHPPGR